MKSTDHRELWEGISSLHKRGAWKSEHLREQERELVKGLVHKGGGKSWWAWVGFTHARL